MKINFKLNSYNFKTDYPNLAIFLSFTTLCLSQIFHISSVIYFLIDIPVILMLFQSVREFPKVLCSKQMVWITFTLFMIFSFMMVGAIINNVSVGNVVYGIYKYFRGIVYFYCVFLYVDERSIEQTISIFKIFFWINVVITMLEFFVLKINQDLLGGVFGLTVGVNQYTNLFFVIVSVYCIEKIITHDTTKRGYYSFLIITGFMLAIAALAEIKYFFAEFAVLFVIGYLCTKKNVKSVFGIIAAIASMFAFYNLLIYNFPEFANLMQELSRGGLARLADLQRHYSTNYDIGRAVVFSYSNRYLLPEKINQWFGMGIGNVTSSGFVNNSFWINNQATHYDQFYTAYLYNEQGIVGFVLYCLFYFEVLVVGIKALVKPRIRKYGTMLIMLVVGCIMIFAYNMALFSQLNFIAFWALAVLMKKSTSSFKYRG